MQRTINFIVPRSSINDWLQSIVITPISKRTFNCPSYRHSSSGINVNSTTNIINYSLNQNVYAATFRFKNITPISIPKLSSKLSTTTTTTSAVASGSGSVIVNNAVSEPPPTQEQLRTYFISHAIPMIGFSFMDQTVMIQAGHAIDCSLGVLLGLSTLSAAALGSVFSSCCGVLFGGTMDALAKKAGIPPSNLSNYQRSLPKVRRTHLFSQLFGVIFGCLLGLTNLFFLDTTRPQSLKVAVQQNLHEFSFDVEYCNDVDNNASIFVLKGPNIDGVLASVTTTLTSYGLSLIQVSANKSTTDEGDCINDTFVVVRSSTKELLPDKELPEVARLILDATKNTHFSLAERVKELEDERNILHKRIQSLEGTLVQKRISLVKRRITVPPVDARERDQFMEPK